MYLDVAPIFLDRDSRRIARQRRPTIDARQWQVFVTTRTAPSSQAHPSSTDIGKQDAQALISVPNANFGRSTANYGISRLGFPPLQRQCRYGNELLDQTQIHFAGKWTRSRVKSQMRFPAAPANVWPRFEHGVRFLRC
jgi:hypothetical protein